MIFEPLSPQILVNEAAVGDETVREVVAHYTEYSILAAAEFVLRRKCERDGELSTPDAARTFLRTRLGHLPHEEFHAVWLDLRHRILAVDRLFNGTIDGASVFPREVVRRALEVNAAAVIFAHNHPGGSGTPSVADREITDKLTTVLGLIAVRVLDHFVVTAGFVTSVMY